MVWVELFLSSLVGLFLGLGLAIFGRDRLGSARRIVSTPSASTVELSDGTVKVEGEISRVEGDHVSGPFTDEEAAFVEWMVEDWNEMDGNKWERQVGALRFAPFWLSDGAGEVLVDLGGDGESKEWGTEFRYAGTEDVFDERDGVELRPLVDGERHEERVGVDEEPPEHLAEFVAETDELDEQEGSITNVVDVGKAHGDRRYTERRLGVGDEVYILGEYDAAERVVTASDDFPTLLTDKSETRVLARRALVGGGAVLLGVSMFVASVAGLYFGVVW